MQRCQNFVKSAGASREEKLSVPCFHDTQRLGATAASGDVHVRFGGGNRGIQVAAYHGSMEHLAFFYLSVRTNSK
jgi:hypothetical protein